MLKHTKFIFILLYFFILPLNAATLIVDNGFESGDLSGFKCSGNCPKIATSPTANGNYAGNFILDRNMSTPYRTEVTLTDGKGSFQFGKEYWVSFDYRFEDWAKDESPETGPFQIHTKPSSWDSECYIASSGRATSPLLMTSVNDEITLLAYNRKVLWKGPIQKKQWLNITFHLKISWGDDGFIEAWKDGVKLGRIDGPNSPHLDNCGLPFRPPYLKMGIYKWEWKDGRPATDSTRRELLIDNLKIATGSNGYSLVSSTSSSESSPSPDTTPPTISNIQAAVTGTTAIITWNTNEASDSLINYGLSNSYGWNADNDQLITSHSITMENLTADELYHYRVTSTDSSGNAQTSSDLSFTTNSTTTTTGGDLVAHWSMAPGTGTTVPDISGNGYTGALVNGAQLANNGGIKLDGIDDYMDVGGLNVADNEMTVAAWFWADDLSNCSSRDCRILSKATGVSEQDHYFMVSTVKVDSATRLRFRLKTNGETSTLVASSGNLLNKEWVHVAAVYDGTTMRLYKDGVEVGSTVKTGDITTNSGSPVWIGGNPSNATSRPWKGQIDDVRIYSYALTKAEVEELTSDGATTTEEQDELAPVISNIQAAVTETTATITWNTNEASDSLVNYGLSNNYGLKADNDQLITSHSITMENLTADELYHYRVTSTDSSGNAQTSSDLSFTTNSTTTTTGGDLVAHWSMDPGTGTTVPDISGNGYTGTLINGAQLANNGGIKLDGINDYMDVGGLNAAGNEMTVAAWFWADDLSNCSSRDCRILSKATGLSEKHHYFMVSTIKVGKKTRLRFRLKTKGRTSTLVAASGNLSNKEWVHVAAVYDGTAMRLYKDGVEVGSKAKTGNITTNSGSPVWIGGNPPSAKSRPWKGQIDDVRIYDHALTKTEVAEMANE